MSEAYLHGFNLITEAVRQVRGTSTNQVPGATWSLVTSGEGVPTGALLLRGAELMAPDGPAADRGSALLLPAPDTDSAPFWDGCAAGELRVQRCVVCGHRRMPPRPMCPWCRSLDVIWETTSGRGRIWSFVVAHPPLLAAYAEQAPYNVVVVELDDDPTIRFAGNLVATPHGSLGEVDPATIVIGEPVEVCFAPPVDGIALPRWRRPG